MNNNMMNNAELSMDELNDVNGGCPFLVGAILYSVGVVGGAIYYASSKKKSKK